MDLHDRVVGGNALGLELLGAGVEIFNSELAFAARRTGARKHAFRIERQDRALELQHFVGAWILDLGAVPRAVFEHHLDGARLTIDHHAPALGEKDHRRGRIRGVGGEHAEPAAAVGWNLANVEHDVGEILEEHPRPDFALGAVHRNLGADLAEGLVAVRHRLQHHPRGRAPAEHGEDQQRLEQAIRADAAGHHHHEFAIGGEPAEAHQQTDQQRHRNRQGQCLRQQGDRQLQDGGDRHPLRNHLLG